MPKKAKKNARAAFPPLRNDYAAGALAGLILRIDSRAAYHPRPVLTSFSLTRPSPSSRVQFAPHLHSDFEFILVVSGTYRCRVNGIEIVLHKHSALVVQPGDWHEDFGVAPLEYAGLRFRIQTATGGEDARLRVFREGVTPEQRTTRLPSAQYVSLLRDLLNERRLHDIASSHLPGALLETLFWWVLRAFDPGLLASWVAPGPEGEIFRDRLRSCFAEHVREPLTAPEVARKLGLSQRTLTQRCTDYIGTSPAKAFLQFKLNHARDLLERTEMKVKDVGYHLGFANPYHFSNAYRQAFGHPPSQDKVPMRLKREAEAP